MNTTQLGKSTVDHATHTITFQRTFEVSLERVFDAWTKSEQIAEWWDPTGARLSESTIDLRPGGAFKLVNRDSAHGPAFAGVYRTIERPTLLVFEANGATGTVSLERHDERTSMTVSIRCRSTEHLAKFLQVGVDVGTNKTLDNLVHYFGLPKR